MSNTLERYRNAVADRNEWINTYEEVGRYCWPNARHIVKSVTVEDKGQVLTTNIADCTAIKAALRMTSGIVSYLMPIGTWWFEFKPSDPTLLKNREVLRRTSEATEITHAEMFRSNFIREIFTTVRSMVTFGTGCISVEKVDGSLVYRNYHIADIFFEENSKGQIDTVFRRMYYTARQMVQEYGEENLSDSVKSALKAKDFSKRFEVVHCVYPRTDYDTSKKDAKGKKFVSKHYEVDRENELKEGGFDSIPYLIGRFERSPDELMGRSPAIDLLPDIKMLNDMRYTFVLSSEKAANPPLVMEDDGVIGQPATGPGDLIIKRQGAEDPHPLQTGANPQLTFEVIQMEREEIYDGFFNNVFQPQTRKRNITATQSDRVEDEKMVMLSPTVSGLQKELLDPLISRTKDLVLPEGLGFDVETVYQGRLALAMSNMQTNAIELWTAKWSPYQQFFPVLDNVNLDEGAATSALNMGVPAKLIRTEEEVAEIRKPQQEAQQLEQQANVAETGSKAIKNLQGVNLQGLM